MEQPLYQVVFDRWDSYREQHVVQTGYIRADSAESARAQAYWIYGDLIDISQVVLLDSLLD